MIAKKRAQKGGTFLPFRCMYFHLFKAVTAALRLIQAGRIREAEQKLNGIKILGKIRLTSTLYCRPLQPSLPQQQLPLQPHRSPSKRVHQ